MTIKPITTRMWRASPLPDEIPSPMAIRRICGVTAWDATVLFSKKCHFALQSLPTCYGEPESVAPKWRIIYSPGPDGNPSD
jgi:hypothetical protein